MNITKYQKIALTLLKITIALKSVDLIYRIFKNHFIYNQPLSPAIAPLLSDISTISLIAISIYLSTKQGSADA